MILSESNIRKIVRAALLENYSVDDTGQLSGPGDEYTYKVVSASDESIRIQVTKNKEGPLSGAFFVINQENKDKPNIVPLLDSIRDNIESFEDITGLREVIGKLYEEEESQSSNDSTSRTSNASSWNPPSNLDFGKKWDELQLRGWFSSTEDVIGGIKYKGQSYFAWGYVALDQSERRSSNHGLAVLLPKEVFKSMRADLGNSNIKAIPSDKTVKLIKPKRGAMKLQTGEGKVAALIKQGTPNIVLGIRELETGATLAADKAIQLLDIIGAIPVLGAGADAANVFVQLSYNPPMYFGAALSALGVIPSIGEVTAIYKVAKGTKKFASGAAAGKSLVNTLKSEFPDGLRAVLKNPSLASTINDNKASIYNFLRKNSKQISKKIPNFDSTFEKFIKFFDDLLGVIIDLKSLPFNKALSKIKEWKALVSRSSGNINSQIKQSIYEPILISTGLYSAYDIDKSKGTYASRIQKLTLEFSEDINNVSEDQYEAISKFVEVLEEKNLIDDDSSSA